MDELPDRFEALLFLQQGEIEPVFTEQRRELTAEAAEHVAVLYTSMADRGAGDVEMLQRFTMQLIWCMFAEDLKLLEGLPLSYAVESILRDKELNSAKEFDYLFGLLNKKSDSGRTGAYSGTRYVNGELFATIDSPMLTRDEMEHLKRAVEFDWKQVNPTIFGSLMEGVLGQERRSALGAHYTHESDIMKIVTPTIVRPWRERIAAVDTVSGGLSLLNELCQFRVLDPACGCGNFLYVAYREMRSLESELKQRITTIAETTGTPKPAGPLPYVPLTNFYGIDIERVSVMIARVVMWMGHRQVMDLYGEAEQSLPLVSLPGIKSADALATEWPEVDAIIGNPPFLGSQLMRSKLGGPYLTWLDSEFKVGIKDLCVYWFRKAHQALKPGQRAGLVGTNSISQNRARGASLEYITTLGGVITDAVSSQKWPGEAKVHVSIVNWIKEPAEPPMEIILDGRAVDGISAALTPATIDEWTPVPLAENKGKCFQGPIPVGTGFIISEATAQTMFADANVDYGRVVRPYLTANDIAESPQQLPSRWIIDFAQMTLEQAMQFPVALKRVRDEVKPFRDTVRRQGHRDKWWLYGEPRVGLRKAVEPLSRYAAVGRHAKRLYISWVTPDVMASDATCSFAFEDDYSMGVLLSRAHDAWAWAQSSTFKGDLRYTPTSVFATFPWPRPNKAQREAIASAAKVLYERRSALCIEHDMGLTKLYNLMDEGGFQDLKALHKALDEAVAEAYGWPTAVAQDPVELVARLRDLNRESAESSQLG